MKRLIALWCIVSICHQAAALNLVRKETGVDRVHQELRVTGKGVIVAILDRGIDYTHPDFRHADGSTRIAAIWDPEGGDRITVYSGAQINAALEAGEPLNTRDAVGHGTTTAGIAAGNGRQSSGKYAGMAPDATLVICKITSDGAPGHDAVPPEAAFYKPELVPRAIDFVLAQSKALGMPAVVLLNIGSMGGPTDGTSELCRKIDSVVGPGKPGIVFVTGPGDEGGRNNHARGVVRAGDRASVQFHKESTGTVDIDMWYPDTDRLEVTIAQQGRVLVSPSSLPDNNDGWHKQDGTNCSVTHLGSGRLHWGAKTAKREIWVQLAGPPGDYTIVLRGMRVPAENGCQFDALLGGGANPPNPVSSPFNEFRSHVFPGGSIWDGGTARNNICPGDYVIRTEWVDIDGQHRSKHGQGDVGELWTGSSVGPTMDGRIGVHICTPGDSIFAPYARESHWGQFRSNQISDGAGWYGRASAVSASAPVAAGIIALMLQANPRLDAIQIREILQRRARSDRFTGEVPNPRWGHGKVDALQAVEEALKTQAK